MIYVLSVISYVIRLFQVTLPNFRVVAQIRKIDLKEIEEKRWGKHLIIKQRWVLAKVPTSCIKYGTYIQHVLPVRLFLINAHEQQTFNPSSSLRWSQSVIISKYGRYDDFFCFSWIGKDVKFG